MKTGSNVTGAKVVPEKKNNQAETGWHARDFASVLNKLESGAEGLSHSEAAQRLQRYGANALPSLAKRSVILRFLMQFHNVLIYVLLGASVITALLGHLVDTGVIVGVVLINALIGHIQEGKAEQALDAIRKMLSLQAQVQRDGVRQNIKAELLVPGDVVFIASGDKVPADLRLIETRSLRVAEAVLTGESVAVEKNVEAVPEQNELGDRFCMAYSGTLVAYGQGLGVVVATGAATEIGRISTMLAQVPELTTPLLTKLAEFGRLLTWTILTACILLFAFGTMVRGYAAGEMFLVLVGLAVAAIPEGLPAIMTITLALGVQRMARRRAIIRRLPAVEALGSVTVICTDKTGTLTKNEMTVQQVLTAGAAYEVSGNGYDPQGSFVLNDSQVDIRRHEALIDIARASLLCNDAELRHEDGQWLLAGDPTEGALISLALKTGLDRDAEKSALPRIDAIPFESEHRFMATLHSDQSGRRTVFVKGAPERVLDFCSMQRVGSQDSPIQHREWEASMGGAASSGMRLLAIAMRSESSALEKIDFPDIEAGGFTLLAVLGITDPPREEAIRSVAACRSAGIRVIMITGDHAATASAIGQKLALSERIHTVTGAALDQYDDIQLQELVASTDVFARASPEHKLRLVSALQARDEVVCMTGDGVNDAPALKRADVGVAMGCRGTEAAKEAAEIVLADDNFASIAAAVEEGRTAYDNIRKSIMFILPTNGGEAGMVLIAILMGISLPITPVQILWVNMVTSVTLSLALAFERTEADIMRLPPRDPKEPLLTRYLVWRICLVSALMVAGSMGLFLWELEAGAAIDEARTVAVNTLVMGEILYLFSCRHLIAPALTWEGITGNRYVLMAIALLLVLQMLFTYVPLMQNVFGTASIGWVSWGKIVLFSVLLLLIVEFEKHILRRSGTASAKLAVS